VEIFPGLRLVLSDMMTKTLRSGRRKTRDVQLAVDSRPPYPHVSCGRHRSLLRVGGDRDVLIQSEQVRRVVAALDLGQPFSSRARIGLTHLAPPSSPRKFTCAPAGPGCSAGRTRQPRLVRGTLDRLLLRGDGVHHESSDAVAERRDLVGHLLIAPPSTHPDLRGGGD
jgi:hypothetical protein